MVEQGVEARWHGGQDLYIGRWDTRADVCSYDKCKMYIPHGKCQFHFASMSFDFDFRSARDLATLILHPCS